MPAPRYANPPRLTATPRHAIDASLCPKIDATLKAARICAQQIAPLESCLQDEMRVLERLYYKGVNQHRMAHFWKRVKEVRRLGQRVLEAKLPNLVDDLRYSFYVAEGLEKNPKMLRSAWLHVPDAPFLNFIYDRTSALIQLLTTVKERFLKAFHAFSLLMQTGAFLQLALVLTATVSRLNAVIEELHMALQSLSNAQCSLLKALGYRKSRLKGAGEDIKPVEAQRRRRPERQEDINMDEGIGEDLGSAILRETVVEVAACTSIDAETHPKAKSITTFWQDSERKMTVDLEPPTPVSSIIVKAESELPANTDASRQAKRKIDANEPQKVKKKKKQKDEIDEIFGFL